MKVTRFIHVNVVCRDLRRSVDFYTDVLGATAHQIFTSGDSDLRSVMGVGATAGPGYRAALVYWGGAKGGPYVDLVEWTEPEEGRRSPLAAHDVGLVRVALEVEDLAEAVKTLEANHVPLLGPIEEANVGPWRLKLVLCKDPDGTLIELVEFPQGQARKNRAFLLDRSDLEKTVEGSRS